MSSRGPTKTSSLPPAPLLEGIRGPDDVKRLGRDQLQPLADEVRDRLIDVVSRTGGHIGAGLGVVELTVALAYCFDSPRDKIVWDVGHQGYPWKILTGRNDRLPTLRQAGGLSGFLRRSESPHDQFGAGHAGTGLSAAFGIAMARDLLGEQYKVVAVVGDGALTCGLPRSEEHTSELQSHVNLVCRLLLEKKKNKRIKRGIGSVYSSDMGVSAMLIRAGRNESLDSYLDVPDIFTVVEPVGVA